MQLRGYCIWCIYWEAWYLSISHSICALCENDIRINFYITRIFKLEIKQHYFHSVVLSVVSHFIIHESVAWILHWALIVKSFSSIHTVLKFSSFLRNSWTDAYTDAPHGKAEWAIDWNDEIHGSANDVWNKNMNFDLY